MKNDKKEMPIDRSFVQDILRQAGQIAIKKQDQLGYQLKEDMSIVTNVDKEIETFLIDKVSKLYPSHKIISEESDIILGNAAYTWVIDPLDGTRVYYGGLPIWGISIGILVDNLPRWGFFYLPKLDEMYIGTVKDAFLNGQKLPPVVPLDFDSPTTFLAVPSQCHSLYDIEITRLRSFGSLAAHLAYVARGIAIGALTQHASIWDIAAMLPSLKAVGVGAKYLSGEEFQLSDLINGSTTKSLLFAHSTVIDNIRERITLK